MFGKFGQLGKLAKQAMEQSKKLAQIEVVGDYKGGLVKVTLNGKMELVNLYIDEKLLEPSKSKELKKAIMKAHRNAMKKVQKELAKTMDLNQILGGN